jgi:type VI secretion system protein ImpL
LQQHAPELVQQLQTNNQALMAIQDAEQISQNTQWIQLLQDTQFLEVIQGTVDFIDNIQAQPLAAYEEISQQETAPVDSTIVAITTLQKRLPVAQQQWLQTIADTLQQACEERAYQYLDGIWQHTVMAIYEKRLVNKFPLNLQGSDALSFADFEQFFGPNGILATYMKLIEPVYHHQALISKLDKENIQAFTTMDKILHHWFDSYKKPRLYLTFVPLELEKNANKFTLEMGNKKLEFSKKLDKTSEFIWPEHGDNITTIEFENTLGQSSIKNQNSPWSLIQLFNESDIETLHGQKDFVITFKLDAFRAKYHVMLQNDFDIKSYGGLTEFHLHQQL